MVAHTATISLAFPFSIFILHFFIQSNCHYMFFANNAAKIERLRAGLFSPFSVEQVNLPLDQQSSMWGKLVVMFICPTLILVITSRVSTKLVSASRYESQDQLFRP